MNSESDVSVGSLSFLTSYLQELYILGFRELQHQRSLAPLMNNF